MEDAMTAAGTAASVPLPPPYLGRVVRLHFCCKAELPMGSSLRVTGSTLWAPSQLTAQDPTNAHYIVKEQTSEAAPTSSVVGDDYQYWEVEERFNNHSNFASSVEMVTSPDTYPIWKTRRPVIVVLSKSTSPMIQHHYYRYMVVTPGAEIYAQQGRQQKHDEGATSNEDTEVSSVMAWEDPFYDEQEESMLLHHGAPSDSSMVSVSSSNGGRKRNLNSLPFRTLDIKVVQDGKVVIADGLGPNQVRVDVWNNGQDDSFRPYLIREAIHKENRKLNANRIHHQQQTTSIMETEDGSKTPPVFPNEQRIFFVCYHLPVVVVKSPATGVWRAGWSESLLAKTEGSRVVSDYNAHWVGTVSPHPPITSKQDQDEVIKLLASMNCIPLFLDSDIAARHYNGFCKQILWPSFHNIDLLDLCKEETVGWDQSQLDGWWEAFQHVNMAFCRGMAELVRPNDIIWIHDYHLSLLPQMLDEWEVERVGRSMTRKIFFLHIPFPTSQIFRELECGEAILQSMLHANVVGFHAFDHARHFLNAAKRILGLDYESMVGGLIGVHFHGKTVLVTISNVSIEPRMADAALMLPTVQAGCDELKGKHGDRVIIAGLDIGQRLSGVSLKFLAYERLLQDYPSWKKRVVMVQRVLLPNSRQTDEANTVRELRFIVKRIQDNFGQQVIDYQEIEGSSMPMDQRLALWKASDVLMLTPIREGLNHWPMEYIYARKEPNPPGIVIASEFSAVCSILNGALRVNPFDIQMTITTIDKALSMDMQEREGRRYRDIDFVSNSTSATWTRNVLRDLRDVIIRQPTSLGDSTSSTPGTPIPGRKELIDSTATYLARESALAFKQLDPLSLKAAYNASACRALIFDFNGTIVIKEPPGKYLKREILGTSGNKPPPEVIEALTVLCADPKNTVYVVSGDSSDNVVNAVGHIPGLGLAASNGGHFSPPTRPGQTQRVWQTFDLGVDWDAVKRVALPVLSKYTARTNGSFVKFTQLSIGWSYYSCDPEWGSLQASFLVLELENELRAFDVRFVTLKGVVEIVPRKLNKGLLVKKVLRDNTILHDSGLDFILCMGDDISDEKMFTSVFSYIAEMGDEENAKPMPPVVGETFDDAQMMDAQASEIKDPMYCYTVAVGKKPSHASQWVENAEAVANLLVTLTKSEGLSSPASWGRNSPSSLFT